MQGVLISLFLWLRVCPHISEHSPSTSPLQGEGAGAGLFFLLSRLWSSTSCGFPGLVRGQWQAGHSTSHPGPLGIRRLLCQGGGGGGCRGGGEVQPQAWGGGCWALCIKRSESTIFHCWQSQPRHQLLGESSLKSLLILFLPLHFFSFPSLASVLDKAPFPPLSCPFPNLGSNVPSSLAEES